MTGMSAWRARCRLSRSCFSVAAVARRLDTSSVRAAELVSFSCGWEKEEAEIEDCIVRVVNRITDKRTHLEGG